MTHHQHLLTILSVVVLGSITGDVTAQPQTKSRLDGYRGGPYKVLADDFTGDGLIDIVLGYHMVGMVTVDEGDGQGNFTPLSMNNFSDENRRFFTDDDAWSEPQIHNLAAADIDDDGLLDLVFGVGGRGISRPGRIIVAKNRGKGIFEKQVEYATPSEAKGVAFSDLDNDGVLDLLYTARGSGYDGDINMGRLSIRRGLGGFQFGEAIESDAGRSAYYIDVGDLNNDGYIDIVVPNEHDTKVTYFINPGEDIFDDGKPLVNLSVSATPIPNVRSHAVNDVRIANVNGDEHLDLISANLGTSTVSVFLGNGDGTFQQDVQYDAGLNGAFLGTGDFDNDGDVDFVIAHWTEDFASVFLNNGDGTFAPRVDYKTSSGNYGIDVADINADSHQDFVTANYREKSMSVALGKGDGTFEEPVTTPKGLRSHNGEWIRTQD
ncbi:MAG: VCBS repeat-containing protein [Planctomycetota bacterium]|nr:VCBS repeat-containing protein [Planctomycetota bacterium]MDA1214514.1 VCBS repeat-containing protein [Planctomycetota bacterium]